MLTDEDLRRFRSQVEIGEHLGPVEILALIDTAEEYHETVRTLRHALRAISVLLDHHAKRRDLIVAVNTVLDV